MCKEAKELVDTHLMPSSLYKMMREEDGGDPNPVVTARGAKSRQTSQQVSDYVLCSDCDGSLSSGGESYILPRLFKSDGSFPLQDTLKQMTAIASTKKLGAFDLSGSDAIDADKLIHFAGGVFWKASVHSWRFGPDEPLRLELGDELVESLRLYLRGEAEWPESAALTMLVAGEESPPWAFFFPKDYGGDSHRRHSFYVPGIEFHLHTGDSDALAQLRDTSLSGPERNIVGVLHLGDHGVTDAAVSVIGDVGVSRRLKEWLERDAT